MVGLPPETPASEGPWEGDGTPRLGLRGGDSELCL